MYKHCTTRRQMMLLGFFWVLLVGNPQLSLELSAQERSAKDRQLPNIVMIISDDQAWGDYGFMGHPHIRTPRLDQLARESLLFTRGYVPDSLCRPSLATIITGLYPHQHGIVGNDPPRPPHLLAAKKMGQNEPDYLPVREAYIDKIDKLVTLPERLGELGYVSQQTGKWWEGNYRRGGFTDGMTHGDMKRGGRHGDAGLTIGREGVEPIAKFIDQAQSNKQPFFVWYAPFLPHTPHNPPKELLQHYRQFTDSEPIAKYWAMCEWFDQSCGELLDLLDQRQLRENTIVLYVTDNGWINDAKQSRYAPRSKRSPNEGGIRTPIMVQWPGKIEPRRNEEQLASSIDLVPTILDLLDQPADAKLPGISLTNTPAVTSRSAIFGEIFEHDIVDMEDAGASLLYRWVIEGDWKLISPDSERLPKESLQLYDLRKDPAENHNLAAENPDVVQRLQQTLDAWWTKNDAGVPASAARD